MYKGPNLTVTPMTLGAVGALWDAIGDDFDSWRWLVRDRAVPRTRAEAVELFRVRMQERNAEYLAYFDNKTGQVLGITAFLDIRPSDRHVEIGSTCIAPQFRGGTTNPEVKYLLLKEAFEVRNCVRVTLKVNAKNQRSRDAVLRIGAKFEGELRNQREENDGTWRTAAIYSVIVEEWPELKQKLAKQIGLD